MSRVVYLSRLALDARSRQVRSELGAPYEMHRTLLRGISRTAATPDEESAVIAHARMLFRVDGVAADGAVITLVQSRLEPDWRALRQVPGYLAAEPQVKALHLDLPVGGMLAFRLRANPTVKRDGRRLGLYREDEQLAWLARKGAASGFTVVRATVATEARAQRSQRKGETVEHLAVRFDGVLCVADARMLADAVADGIGSAKGFGYGLLSLARASG